jgi:hypothetical protein
MTRAVKKTGLDSCHASFLRFFVPVVNLKERAMDKGV